MSTFYLNENPFEADTQSGVQDLKKVLWTDKKRPFFAFPLSFTRYTLYRDRLLVETGFFTFRQEELRLYRVLDVTMRQTFIQRFFGVGSILISSGDSTTPFLRLSHILKPKKVLRLVSDVAESERQRCRIGIMEGIGGW